MTPYRLEDLPTDPASRLRTSLQLPLANRKIFEWLFAHSSAPFHRDATPLAPDSFNDSLIICVTQKVGREDTAPIHVLLLPTAVIDGIAVGYLLTDGDLSDERLHPFNTTAREIAGRFAFDQLSRHVVGVRHGVTDEATAIYSVCWYRGNRRQRCYISVPRQEYNFENPPTKVLGITVKNEYKTASLTRDTGKSTEVDDRRTGTWSGDVEKVHPNVLYDLLPRRVLQKEEEGFEFRRLGSGSGALEQGSCGTWLRELENCLEGRFYSPGVRKSFVEDGEVTLREIDEVRSCVFVTDREDYEELRTRAAREYYAVVLPV